MITKENGLLFTLGLILFLGLSVFFYRHTISLPPSHIHSWVQSDKYAIALRYCEPDASFWLPRTYNIGGAIEAENNPYIKNFEGITASDLPVHEYIISRLMFLFNSTQPIIFRLYVLLLSFVGYLALGFFICNYTRSATKGILFIGLMLSSPILTYYQAGFNPSSTALATALMGYAFYFTYLQKQQKKYFFIAISLLTLSAIVRLPFNMCLIAVFMHQILLSLFSKQWKFYIWGCFAMVVMLITSALYYKYYINKVYGSLFLGKIMMFEGYSEFKELFATIWQNWLFEFLTGYHYMFLSVGILGVLGLFFNTFKPTIFSKNNLLQVLQQPLGAMLLQIILLVGGGSIYFLLMMQQYCDHEYYLIDNYYIPTSLLFAYILCKIEVLHQKWLQISWPVLAIGLLLGGIIRSEAIQKRKYADTDWDKADKTRINYTDSYRFLDSLGISQHAKILVLDGHAPNTPLLGLKRMGFSVVSLKRKYIEPLFNIAPFDYATIQRQFLAEVVNEYPDLLKKIELVSKNDNFFLFRRANSTNHNNTMEEWLEVDSFKSSFFSKCFGTDEQNGDWVPYTHTSIAPDFQNVKIGILDSTTEYGPTIKCANTEVNFKRCLFKGDFYFETPKRVVRVVLSGIQKGNEPFYLEKYIRPGTPKKWQTLYAVFNLPDSLSNKDSLTAYLWNSGKCLVYFDCMSFNFCE